MVKIDKEVHTDIAIVLLLPIIASLASLLFKTNLMISEVLFGLVFVWLSYRVSHLILRVSLFSLVVLAPLWLVWDYLAHVDKSWFVPTIFPFRLFGQLPFEDLFFGFIWIYGVIIFYERFFHSKPHKLVAKRLKYLIYASVILVVAFLALMFTVRDLVVIPYVYVWFGFLFILGPTIVFLCYRQEFIKPFFITGAYIFAYSLLWELTALYLGHWTFTGTNVIGWVEFFSFRLPFEELFFALVVAPWAWLTYYVYFDEKK